MARNGSGFEPYYTQENMRYSPPGDEYFRQRSYEWNQHVAPRRYNEGGAMAELVDPSEFPLRIRSTRDLSLRERSPAYRSPRRDHPSRDRSPRRERTSRDRSPRREGAFRDRSPRREHTSRERSPRDNSRNQPIRGKTAGDLPPRDRMSIDLSPGRNLSSRDLPSRDLTSRKTSPRAEQRSPRSGRSRERSPRSRPSRDRSPREHRDRSPRQFHTRERSPMPDYPREDEDKRWRRNSPKGSPRRSPWRSPKRDSSPRPQGERRDFDRDRRDGDKRRSERDNYWIRGSSSTVRIREVPSSIGEVLISAAVKRFGAPFVSVRMKRESGPNNTSESVCDVQFERVRDAIDWMATHQGELPMDGERLFMEYVNYDRARDSRDRRGSFNKSDDHHHHQPYHRTGPTDTMIVKGLKLDTLETTIRQSFEYITHFPIVDIRLVKDKLGVSRGFCFVQWKSVEDCQQVLEYLRTATPRFHIDGRHVTLDFSTPHGSTYRARGGPQQTSSNAAILAGVQVAEAAIQAAQWQQGKNPNIRRNDDPSLTENKPTTVKAEIKAAPVKPEIRKPAPPPKQKLSAPDQSKFQYDPTSGYYFDPTTGYYYDATSRYFYNNQTGEYMYWDMTACTYKKISQEMQVQQNKDNQKKNQEKEQKEMKNVNAKKIAKDMERWAKAQNKKKEEMKRILDDTGTPQASAPTGMEPPMLPPPRKRETYADAAFSVLEKQVSEAERQAAVKAAYKQNIFRKPELPGAKKKTESDDSGLVSYMKTSDSEEEEEEEINEENFLDWGKLACLLCKRGFPSKDMLVKHKDLSDLHKQNLEKRKINVGSLTKKKQNDSASSIKYRDRAAERRHKFGITEVPKRTERRQGFVPYEQPTKDGIDNTNIGNQMLQKMGWREGSGLGKSRSGITAPIQVQQRSQGSGLGMRGSSYGLDGSDDYKSAAKKVTYARYMETD